LGCKAKKLFSFPGGAGYIGSHVVLKLRENNFNPIVVDSLVNGHRWATYFASEFRHGDIADAVLIREMCRTFNPVAAFHFAAFIDVGESVTDPDKYFLNNRDKSRMFFDVLASEGVNKIVFSSTAAVYGEVSGSECLTEAHATSPINPYGLSKYEAESYLRSLSGVSSVALRYFNVAGDAPEAGLGEAHFPETHLIPRMVLPLIDVPASLRNTLGLEQGFKIYGNDYPTQDGTAVRDYIHVLDLADAHIRALNFLLEGGPTEIFNLGSGAGYSVKEIVQAVRNILNRPDFNPGVAPRRLGDPAKLVASSEKAKKLLGWMPERDISSMVQSAAVWHCSDRYVQTVLEKARMSGSLTARR
jgi:UDP-glucose 4-epimerase